MATLGEYPRLFGTRSAAEAMKNVEVNNNFPFWNEIQYGLARFEGDTIVCRMSMASSGVGMDLRTGLARDLVLTSNLGLLKATEILIKDKVNFVNHCKYTKKKQTEDALFVLTHSKFYVVKLKSKKSYIFVEHHLYDLVGVSLKDQQNVILTVKPNSKKIHLLLSDAVNVITELRQWILGDIFPRMDEGNFWISMNLPEAYNGQIRRRTDPCGSFRNAYIFECDYLNSPKNTSILLNLDYIFASNGIRMFLFNYMYNVSMTDMKAVFGALVHDEYFDGLILDSVKVEKEIVPSIVSAFKCNRSISRLVMNNVHVSSAFYGELFKALEQSKNIGHLGITNSELGESATTSLVGWIGSTLRSMKFLNLYNCNIKSRYIVDLIGALSKSGNALEVLNLGKNLIGNGNTLSISQFVILHVCLKKIVLSDSGLNLDVFLDGLNRGLNTGVAHLDLSYNGAVLNAGSSLERFISVSEYLECIDFTGTKLSPEFTAGLIRAIGGNSMLKDVRLYLSRTNFAESLPLGLKDLVMGEPITNIVELDISDNVFDDQMFVELVRYLRCFRRLRRVNISRVLSSKSSKNRKKAMDAMCAWITWPRLSVEELIFEGGKGVQLGSNLIGVVCALANSNLKVVDLSGHNVGVVGAYAMSYVIFCRDGLKKVVWRENGITMEGLQVVRNALERNRGSVQEFLISAGDVRSLLNESGSGEYQDFNIVGFSNEGVCDRSGVYDGCEVGKIERSRRRSARLVLQFVMERGRMDELMRFNEYVENPDEFLKKALHLNNNYGDLIEFMEETRAKAVKGFGVDTAKELSKMNKLVENCLSGFKERIAKYMKDTGVFDSEGMKGMMGALDVIEEESATLSRDVCNYVTEKMGLVLERVGIMALHVYHEGVNCQLELLENLTREDSLPIEQLRDNSWFESKERSQELEASVSRDSGSIRFGSSSRLALSQMKRQSTASLDSTESIQRPIVDVRVNRNKGAARRRPQAK